MIGSLQLPEAAARKPAHTRKTEFHVYARDDGMWDIDAVILDTKPYPLHTMDSGLRQPGDSIHQMAIRVTIDEEMTVRSIATAMAAAPFNECPAALDPMQKMVGASMTKGWRRSIDAALGGTLGCTHLRELLFNMATPAYQAIRPYRQYIRIQNGEPVRPRDKPPGHLGGCMTWDAAGPMVRRLMPAFAVVRGEAAKD